MNFWKILIFLFLFNKTFAQTNDRYEKNYIYYDLLGHTRSIFSLNYQRNIYNFNDYTHLDIRTGIGFEGGYKIEGKIYNRSKTIPTVIVFLIGKKHHFINFSAGYSVTFTKGLLDETVTPNLVFPRFDSAISFGLGYSFRLEGLFIHVYPVRIKPKDSEKYEKSLGLSFGFAF